VLQHVAVQLISKIPEKQIVTADLIALFNTCVPATNYYKLQYNMFCSQKASTVSAISDLNSPFIA